MTKLSPAAQAVMDTYWSNHPVYHPADKRAVASALRAAADKLKDEIEAPGVDGSKYYGIWHSFDYLNAIAAELEGQ